MNPRAAIGVLALLPLVTCAPDVPPRRPLPADDRDRLIGLMGEIDAHVMGVQQAAGDPVEPERLRRHLAAIRARFEAARGLELLYAGLEERIEEATALLRSLEAAEWTASSRADGYGLLRRLCATCHEDYAPPIAAPPRMPGSWEACGRCHEKAYREWQGTLHATAWTDPVYRLSAGNPPKPECRACHSMEPILERDISTAPSYRPVFRPYHHEEGVNCMACHGLADGSVAAARDLPEAPCRPRRDERLLGAEFCGACHNPTHGAYDEWRAWGGSRSCADCHARGDGPFSHRMAGVHDAAFVRKGLDWSCEVRDGALRIELRNRSGHRFPAEVPTRTLRIRVEIDGRFEEIFLRRPPKAAVGPKDNRLYPGEVRVLSRPAAGARRVRVEIRFQRSPFERPAEWVDLGTWEKKF
ncbi:MAG TPA: multiheme c-type cytochrome [Planctomycetota bacterium]|nr:multiheme c-type cytochrome [Planctomycetota bacterium]